MSTENTPPASQGFVTSLLRHVGQYLSAIYSGWVGLVSGVAGVVLLILLVFWGDDYAFLKDNKKTFVWTAFICLLLAGFSAWRKERQRWERLGGLGVLSLTPKELVSVFKGRTTTQGEKLVKSYIGKVIRLSRPIADVRISRDPLLWRRAVIVTFMGMALGEPNVFLRFSRKWASSLSVLREGEVITVIGRIHSIDQFSVWLSGCELIEVHTPQENE
jgi:hypothetical protein